MKTTRFNKKGITLVEVLLVVTLIGIMAGLAVPNFDNAITKIRHKSAVRDILRDMRLARSYAISRSGRYGVYFNTTGKYHILFKDTDKDGIYDAGEQIKDSTLTCLGANISFGNCGFTNSAVVFTVDGSASESDSVEVINDKSSASTKICVNAAVGRVYLSTN